jgi:hypothetical protein
MDLRKKYKVAKEWAESYSDKLLTAGSFKYSIKIEHLDGSVFDIKNVFVQINNEFIIVFSEHNSYFIFFREDLKKWDISDFSGAEVIHDF